MTSQTALSFGCSLTSAENFDKKKILHRDMVNNIAISQKHCIGHLNSCVDILKTKR